MTINEPLWDWADVAAIGVVARIMVPRSAKHPVRLVLEAYEWKLAGVRQAVAVIAQARRDDYHAGIIDTDSIGSAAGEAIDAIASVANGALGTPDAGWDYPGQVVRDVEQIASELCSLRVRLAQADDTSRVIQELREVAAVLTGEQATREKMDALMAEVSSRPTLKLLPEPTVLAWLAVGVDASIISSGKASEICGIDLEQWREQVPEFAAAMQTLHDAAMAEAEAEAVMLKTEVGDDDCDTEGR